MPVGYSPLYHSSAVLPDGRLIIEGGEYLLSDDHTTFVPTWSAKGAIYDPIVDIWTAVEPPPFFNGGSPTPTIGDAQSVVLANGTYMQANCCTTEQALLDARTLTWTPTGQGKLTVNDEEGWTLLPNGKVLTVDAYVFAYDLVGHGFGDVQSEDGRVDERGQHQGAALGLRRDVWRRRRRVVRGGAGGVAARRDRLLRRLESVRGRPHRDLRLANGEMEGGAGLPRRGQHRRRTGGVGAERTGLDDGEPLLRAAVGVLRVGRETPDPDPRPSQRAVRFRPSSATCWCSRPARSC